MAKAQHAHIAYGGLIVRLCVGFSPLCSGFSPPAVDFLSEYAGFSPGGVDVSSECAGLSLVGEGFSSDRVFNLSTCVCHGRLVGLAQGELAVLLLNTPLLRPRSQRRR